MDVVESAVGHDDDMIPGGGLGGQELQDLASRSERVGPAPKTFQGPHYPFGRQYLGWIQTFRPWTGATIATSAKPSAALNSCSNRDRREV